jgi:multimeric flavodoxin WrbA
MKAVLGLISSPRKHGNCEIMTKEIMSHTGSNNRLQILRLQDLYIEPCMACYSCKKPGKRCPRDDDMPFLFQSIAEADGIIISSPVYNWGANIGIQRVIDRLFLFSGWRDLFAGKPCVTFVTYGVPYEEGYALSTLNGLARELNLRVKETAAFLGSLPGEALRHKKNMETARLLGQALFSPSYKRKRRNFECPNCLSNIVKFRSEMDLPSPELRPIGHVECAFCGTVMELKANKGGVEVHYHGKGLYADGIPERLAKFHERAIKSFVKGRENIKKTIERYKMMDVEILSKGEDSNPYTNTSEEEA